MQVFSHRGFHVTLPENTLAAFEAAVALGVAGIETDVQLDRHGEAFLYHDRLAPDLRPVAHLSRAELSALIGCEVPTLEAALATCAVTWNLEIKAPDAVAATIEAVRRHRERRRFLISSFWHAAVYEVCEATGVAGGLLIAHRPRRIDPADFRPQAGIATLVWSFDRLDASCVNEARQLGLATWVYSAESRADHDACRAWGVDCLITDRPDWLLT
ncbi:MAG: glycerophosphodiester phosphodiesterase [Pirellulales bacterium]|nr:glycerophosphodiester phosphodiesterase [Pirellulales bacterium]